MASLSGLHQRSIIAARTDGLRLFWIIAVAALHLAALGLLVWSEAGLVPKATFVLTWGVLNFWWLLWLRRPAASAALSLAMIIILIVLSRFKHEALLMTANFIDLMLIDEDTISFLLKVFPNLERTVGLILAVALPALALLWWLDPFRMRLRSAALGGIACLAGLAALSLAVPSDREEELESSEYVSKFARSAAVGAIDLLTRGLLESDTAAASHLAPVQGCAP